MISRQQRRNLVINTRWCLHVCRDQRRNPLIRAEAFGAYYFGKQKLAELRQERLSKRRTKS